MKFFKLIALFIVLICAFIFTSCGGDKPKVENSLTEGVIQYKADVVDATHPMAGLAPGEATVKFKNNNLMVELSVMGVLNTRFVSMPSNGTLSQMVKFLDIKSACIETREDLCKDKEYELKFEETKDTKKIAGYLCKRVKTSFVNDPTVTFDTYYTSDLGLDSINNVGPYKQLKGMLMQYRLKKLGLEMCFTATSVKEEEINDTEFEIPTYYKIITRPEMDKLFEDFQK